MKTILRCVLPLLVAALVMPVVAAPTADSVKQSLQNLYNKEDAAATNKNVDGMVADYDPNVVAIMANGDQKGYADIVSAAHQVVGMAKTIRSTTDIKSISMDGDKAVATTHGSVIMTIAEPTTQNDMTIATTSNSHDTWAKVNGRWRIVKSVEIDHTATVDGQPMPGV